MQTRAGVLTMLATACLQMAAMAEVSPPASSASVPVDAGSQALFAREGLQVSLGNTWAMEIEPGARFIYELARTGRLLRVEFDLTRPAPAPPAPWGK